MHTRSEQRDLLTSVRLKDGETKRMDCPFCGGKNTFTLTRKNGSRVWNCYKASCKAAGGNGDTRALTTIQKTLRGDSGGSERVNPEPIPSTVSDPEHHAEVVQYLKQINALESYESGLVRIAYDPKENRVLFFMNGGKGAVGRALDNRKPKWKAFGDVRGVFTCGKGPVAVVVEDAASAAAVGCLPEYTGVALLGTHMDMPKKAGLMAFERVVLCLDNDASKKSIDLLRKVQGLVPATVRFLRDDLKWLTKDQIREVLK